jgi:uncharacterized protein with ATP-grasp and redox domains
MNSQRPTPIQTNSSNEWANYSMKVRAPKIIEDIQTQNPDYPKPVQDALKILRHSIENDAHIPMIDLPAPDRDEWAVIYVDYAGDTWLNSEWFFAETFVYRHIMQAVRWWENYRDPFAPKKAEELASDTLWSFLDLALADRTLDYEERLAKLLFYALWGNRIDLSYTAGIAHGQVGAADELIENHTDHILVHLHDHAAGGVVHIVGDNTGTELAADLVLVEALLERVDQVMYHVKMHPTFVSDTTVPDFHRMLSCMEGQSADTKALATTLNDALDSGRLRLIPDLYWNNSRWLWDLPPRLYSTFKDATLVILKGDLNYRRAIGDAIWSPGESFAEAVSYFPAPLLALRTLKSDALVGSTAELEARLNASDPKWRFSGRYGVIQFARNG